MNDLKTKVDGLDASKLQTAPVALNKVSHAVDNEVVKNIKLITLKKKTNSSSKKIPDATTLIHINQYKTDKQNVQKKLEK